MITGLLLVIGGVIGAGQQSDVNESADYMQLQKEAKVLEDMLRRIKFQILDINDSMQAFIQAKGIVSLIGPNQSAEWIMMKLLAEKRLDARLQVRLAKAKLIQSAGTELEPEMRTDYEASVQYHEILEDEAKILNTELSGQAANYSVYEHMNSTAQLLRAQRDEMQRSISETRFHRMMLSTE